MSSPREFGLRKATRWAGAWALVGLLVMAIPPRARPEESDDVPLSGEAEAGLAELDRLMTGFVRQHQVPGAALAVTYRGRLVYSRGFGYADKEAREPVRPDSLFRIASVSKPLTAVAVLQLVERGKLQLNDKVFELLHCEPPPNTKTSPDPRLQRITVRHLLHHVAGWDRDRSFDPMFRSIAIARALNVRPPARPEHIIRYMLAQPLDFDPGQRYAYSNFGYCLLGRVVEKVAGTTYEEYVQKEVLAPLGLRDMKVGKTLPDGRATREVHYYDPKNRLGPAVIGRDIGKPVPLPYGNWYLEAMDAHGGWTASAVDLVRFAAAFDDPARCPVLGEKSIRTMLARPEMANGSAADQETYYACGWQVRLDSHAGKTYWHNGSLPGSASMLVCRPDRVCWAVLFNASEDGKGKYLSKELEGSMAEALDGVRNWPEGNLFGD